MSPHRSNEIFRRPCVVNKVLAFKRHLLLNRWAFLIDRNVPCMNLYWQSSISFRMAANSLKLFLWIAAHRALIFGVLHKLQVPYKGHLRKIATGSIRRCGLPRWSIEVSKKFTTSSCLLYIFVLLHNSLKPKAEHPVVILFKSHIRKMPSWMKHEWNVSF